MGKRGRFCVEKDGFASHGGAHYAHRLARIRAEEEITSLPFVYEIPAAYRGVYFCRVLDTKGNVLYER